MMEEMELYIGYDSIDEIPTNMYIHMTNMSKNTYIYENCFQHYIIQFYYLAIALEK